MHFLIIPHMADQGTRIAIFLQVHIIYYTYTLYDTLTRAHYIFSWETTITSHFTFSACMRGEADLYHMAESEGRSLCLRRGNGSA